MVKLATAREFHSYGTRRARYRCEYINAGLYLFATFVLVLGFLLLHYQHEAYKPGLVLQLIGIGLIALVNAHDLFAHLAGVDYCLALLSFDLQLGLVEFTAPVLHLVGSILMFIGVLSLLIQVCVLVFLFLLTNGRPGLFHVMPMPCYAEREKELWQ